MVTIKSVLSVLSYYFPFSRLRQVSSLNSNPFLNNSYGVGVRMREKLNGLNEIRYVGQ